MGDIVRDIMKLHNHEGPEAADEIERLRAERDAHRDAHAAAQNVLDALYGERDRLREALRQAIDCVEHWAAYADSYSIAKYDLAGDLRDLRAALEENRA